MADATTVALTLEALSPILAWWVGMLFMILGAYIIFPCERSDPGLMAFGFGNGLLGAVIYIAVRAPEWKPPVLTTDLLVPVALILIAAGGVHATWLVWQTYELELPHVRLRKVTRGWYFRARNTYRKFRE